MIKIKSGKVKIEAWMIVLVLIIVGIGIYTLYTPETSFVEEGDNSPPTAQILEPIAGETVSGEVRIKIRATDIGTGIDKVEVHIGHWYIAEADPIKEPNIYVYDWDTVGTPNGQCEITVKAYDYTNNVCETSITVNIKNQLII